MIRSVLVASVALASSVAAHAADPRLVVRPFAPDEVVRIDGRSGVQATIAFAEDEHIENVAIGDSATWQVTPNKRANLLFVKPTATRARTNMTVVTDRYAYYFDLVAGGGRVPVYALRFTYPDARLAPTPAMKPQDLSADEAQALSDKPADRPVDPAVLNFAWDRRGAQRLLPSRVYDNGVSTYLAWAPGAPLPAILVRDARGAEGPVNFAVRDDVIVVDGVHPVIVLRAGKELATLESRRKAQPALAAPPSPASASPALEH